jgi:hypothetical protein
VNAPHIFIRPKRGATLHNYRFSERGSPKLLFMLPESRSVCAARSINRRTIRERLGIYLEMGNLGASLCSVCWWILARLGNKRPRVRVARSLIWLNYSNYSQGDSLLTIRVCCDESANVVVFGLAYQQIAVGPIHCFLAGARTIE